MKLFACNLRGFLLKILTVAAEILITTSSIYSCNKVSRLLLYWFVLFPLYQTCYSPESCTTQWRCVSTHSPSGKEPSGKQLDASLKTTPASFLKLKGFILKFYSDLEPLNDIILPRVLLIIHENMYLLQECTRKRSVHLANPRFIFILNWNPILTVQTKGNFDELVTTY